MRNRYSQKVRICQPQIRGNCYSSAITIKSTFVSTTSFAVREACGKAFLQDVLQNVERSVFGRLPRKVPNMIQTGMAATPSRCDCHKCSASCPCRIPAPVWPRSAAFACCLVGWGLRHEGPRGQAALLSPGASDAKAPRGQATPRATGAKRRAGPRWGT